MGMGQSIEQVAVVQAIIKDGSNNQRIVNMVRVQQMRQLQSGPCL
jgi:hypothetical protein